MNPDAQRIAIAEACGWKWEAPFNPRKAYNDLIHPKGTKHGGMARVWKDGGLGGTGLLDYTNDLNAMHEAEKTLSDVLPNDQYAQYCENLNELVCGCGNTHTCGFTLCATAAQRAEAFLRTLSLWQDEP